MINYTIHQLTGLDSDPKKTITKILNEVGSAKEDIQIIVAEFVTSFEIGALFRLIKGVQELGQFVHICCLDKTNFKVLNYFKISLIPGVANLTFEKSPCGNYCNYENFLKCDRKVSCNGRKNSLD